MIASSSSRLLCKVSLLERLAISAELALVLVRSEMRWRKAVVSRRDSSSRSYVLVV